MSVILPIFNGANGSLEKCLISVVNQSYSNIEIIALNDASSDNSHELAKNILLNVENARLINHTQNMGLAATINHGLEEVSGDYILLLEQDCILSNPKVIEQSINFLQEHLEIDVLIGTQLWNPDGLNFFQRFIEFRLGHLESRTDTDFYDETLTENKCDIFRKKVFDITGKFSERFSFAGEDHEFSLNAYDHKVKMVKSNRLSYYNSLDGEKDLISIARKEYNYGKSMPMLFLSSYLRVNLKRTGSEFLRRKILNRAAIITYVAGAVLSAGFSILLKQPLFLLITAGFVVARFVQVRLNLSRMRNNLNEYTPSYLIFFFTLFYDVVYYWGAFVGLIIYAIKHKV